MVLMAIIQKWDQNIHRPSEINLNNKYLLLCEITQEEYDTRDFGAYEPKITSGECIVCLVEKYTLGEYCLAHPQMIVNTGSSMPP